MKNHNSNNNAVMLKAYNDAIQNCNAYVFKPPASKLDNAVRIAAEVRASHPEMQVKRRNHEL